jgi:hypothetical protein
LIFLISDFVCLWQAGQLQWELQQLPGFSLHTNDSNFLTSYYYCINIFIQISTWFVIFGSQQRKQILYVKTYNDWYKGIGFLNQTSPALPSGLNWEFYVNILNFAKIAWKNIIV